MIKRLRFPKIYYGWWINLVTGITSGLAFGFTQQGASVLFKPIAADLGLNRTATSVASSTSRLEGGIQAPITGMLSDKFGAKWVLVAGALIMGTGLVLMNFVVDSMWSYYIVWGVIIASGNNLGFALAVDKVLTNWFVKKRGLGFGVRFAIMGIMQVAIVPIVSWLTITYSWRTTCLIWGMVIFASIPFTLYFVKQNRPEYYGLLPDGAKVESGSEESTDTMIDKGIEYAASVQETEFTLKQAMRTSAYWMLAAASCAFGITNMSFNVHSIPFLTDRGIEPGTAAGLLSMMFFFTIPSKFLFGVFADRVRKQYLKFLLAASFLLMTVGVTIFLLNQTTAMIYGFLVFWGLGTGGFTPVNITMVGRYFGRKAFGSIQGTQHLFSSLISLFAPVYAGWVYDVSHSYNTAFTTFAGIAAFAIFLSCLIRIPKPPAHISGIRQFR